MRDDIKCVKAMTNKGNGRMVTIKRRKVVRTVANQEMCRDIGGIRGKIVKKKLGSPQFFRMQKPNG